jgi:hypothetical protein
MQKGSSEQCLDYYSAEESPPLLADRVTRNAKGVVTKPRQRIRSLQLRHDPSLCDGYDARNDT